jgi:hypothetical protein
VPSAGAQHCRIRCGTEADLKQLNLEVRLGPIERHEQHMKLIADHKRFGTRSERVHRVIALSGWRSHRRRDVDSAAGIRAAMHNQAGPESAR